MKRREFLSLGAAGMAATLWPDASMSSHDGMHGKNHPVKMDPEMDGDVKEFRLFIDIVQHEITPGVKIHTLGFNGTVPGPELRVNSGDKVRVYFENRTELNHTIHWHGMHVPWRMDGVPYVTQMPVMPGTEFVYEFEAKPSGTHFYHCHWGTLLHMQAGMFGSLIIDQMDDPVKRRFAYDREYTLIYSAHDLNFLRKEMNVMLERMKERMYLMKNGRFDKERFNLFDSKEELLTAIEGGYAPPYVTNRRAPSELPEPNWFTVNGKSYPDTPTLYINEGENIRVRLINAGTEEHYLHLHGHDFWLVCEDGLTLPQFRQMNTVGLSPGKTFDIVIEGTNRGLWTFHDHDTRRVTNNGLYPGGTLLLLAYEDLPMEERMVGTMQVMDMNMEGMGEMEGMDMDGMHGHGGNKNMLPKVALDE